MSDNQFKRWVRERIITWIITILLFIVFAIWATTSDAQLAKCAPTTQAHERLSEVYGEVMVKSQENPELPGTQIELWANPETGSYTVLIYPSPGLTCLVAAGINENLIDQGVGA